jgi:hypothetical protein
VRHEPPRADDCPAHRLNKGITMRIRTILAAAAAPAALAAVLLGTAGQASAAVTQSAHAEGTIQLTQNADSDFSGQTWALDNFAQHQVITNIVQTGKTYSYDVKYDLHGTFTTQVSNYVGHSNPSVAIPLGAHGVMDGSGQVHVTDATQVPDQKYLKALDGSTASESAVLAPGGSIQWNHYDYNYKIPGTSFSAEQSDTVNTP